MTHLAIRKINGDYSEMRELAARICRDYLHGGWKNVTAQNIGFKHISGGLSNLLYHISLPEPLVDKDPINANPAEVLIRVYGQTHGERALEVLITESVIFTLLSERGLGPKLHGVFPGGRIEQYIKARPLLTSELADAKLSELIAQKMASIHSMQVPLHKSPGWLWETVDRWLKSAIKQIRDDIPDHARHIQEIDLEQEARWLRQQLEYENSPVVFCHNDMQEGNILLSLDDSNENNNGTPNLVLIDFEYCSYNYRAFDIANHFAEWMYDYTEKEHPFFKATAENYPSEQQRLRFVRTYLEEKGSDESPKKILKEVKAFTLASHFFWALWSFVNTKACQIPFGYWEYGVTRLNAYLKLKSELTHPQATKRKLDDLE